MATRFYLPSSGAGAVNPNPDSAWEDTSLISRLRCVTSKSSSTMTTVTFTDSNLANRDVLFRQYISDPISAQTISAQTVKFQIRASETDVNSNMFTAIGIRVVNQAGTAVTGTVLSVARDATEIALTTLTNRQFSATTTQVVANANDRIVIEIGTAGDPANGSAGHDTSLRIGDAAASDLAEDDLSVLDNNPWVEFANTITIPTNFSQSGSMTSVGVQSVSKNINLSKTIASIGIQSFVKSVSIVKTIVVIVPETIIKAASKSFSNSSVGSLVASNSLLFNQIVNCTSIGIASFSKSLVLAIISNILAVGNVTISRIIKPTINIISAGSVSVNRVINIVGTAILSKATNSIYKKRRRK